MAVAMEHKHLRILPVAVADQVLLDQTVEQLHQVTVEPVLLLAFPDRLLHMQVAVVAVYTLQGERLEPVAQAVAEPATVLPALLIQAVAGAVL